jgi:hypothetical protein
MSDTNTPPVTPTEAPDAPVRGRSIFMVETVAAGVAVRTGFMTEDGRLLDMPAVFPDPAYALAQIDELRRLVSGHFAQAAQVGAQVIAAQAAAAAQAGVGSDATEKAPVA